MEGNCFSIIGFEYLHNHSLTNIDTVIPGYIENLKLLCRDTDIMHKVE